MGLACYHQEGAGGLTAAGAMVKAYSTAIAKPGVRRVRYWSLEAMTGTVAAFVTKACRQVAENRTRLGT